MDSSILFVVLLLLSAGVEKARAVAIVVGCVFCDQCKDGQMTPFFDYRLFGAKVAVTCPGSDGKLTVLKEANTTWLGSYAFNFKGSPDLSRCTVQVVPGSGQGASGNCMAAAGPARGIKLLFKLFGALEMYAVDAVLSQPAQPMSLICPKSPGSKVPVSALAPQPAQSPPSVNLEASACPSGTWTMPRYKCYWKVVGPDTKVADAFGLVAARRYGTNMTLLEGLQGKGDVYRTLLREGTTALLNTYNNNNIQFAYLTPSTVKEHMSWALMVDPEQALQIALRFKRANSGSGNVHCNFTPCK